MLRTYHNNVTVLTSTVKAAFVTKKSVANNNVIGKSSVRSLELLHSPSVSRFYRTKYLQLLPAIRQQALQLHSPRALNLLTGKSIQTSTWDDALSAQVGTEAVNGL